MNPARRRSILQIIIALCALPALVSAQRGGGGGGGRGGGGGNSKYGSPTRASPIEIPKIVNAVNLLIEHRQDLALSDSQFVRVIRIKRSADSTNSPLMRRLDSIQVLFKGPGPLFGDAGPERRDSLTTARSVIQETLGSVRDNIADAREKAYGLLSAQQLAKAEGYEEKAAKAIEDEKQGARGRGGPGGPPH
jgi:hypothetical protein